MLPVPNPEVIYRSLSDGAVLLAMKEEVYFGLNRLGMCVWELLPPVRNTLDELCADLERQYPDVAPQTIRQDAIEFLEELTAQGLVLPREAGDGNAAADATGG